MIFNYFFHIIIPTGRNVGSAGDGNETTLGYPYKGWFLTLKSGERICFFLQDVKT